ncbi:hypothetical protein GCM10007043_13190 [Calditerricola satsumensis]|uniref:Uncharacterized protein n=1 Tax=Calditerricola satsumensis TaxID=373054 RepID=A0A8J3BCC9_9BACI|nr:hypothetical protein GCM10007043_13190 [Calditerricola satsumensis]
MALRRASPDNFRLGAIGPSLLWFGVSSWSCVHYSERRGEGREGKHSIDPFLMVRFRRSLVEAGPDKKLTTRAEAAVLLYRALMADVPTE